KEVVSETPKIEEKKKRIHKVMVKPVKVKAVAKKPADSDDDEPPTTVVQGYVQPAEKAEKPVSKPGVDAAPAGPPPIPFTPKRTEPVPPPDYNYADQFSADDEGTMVLSDYKPNEPETPPAKLLRRSTNETVLISKNVFTLGKERAKVDYCVTNNKTVSRMHATIYRRGNVYYIVDSNSTNGTFVNNSRIPAQTEVKLNNGDLLRLSNEEFDFKED
ncbi:MAG: FHA domain-containing protein, partial [Ruminococcus sp.]|nr:FHA domain-containing protein [Ruminococcus sp.]